MHYFIRVFLSILACFITAIIFVTDTTLAASYKLSGEVHVTNISDGDSLRSGKLKIRIYGIDAPELKQQCQDLNGVIWACGVAARNRLESLVGTNKRLHCELRDVDRYGRLVMQCFIGTVDIGAAMVKTGHALAYRTYSDLYTREEQQAQSANHGVWRGAFLPPWEWRRQN